MLYQSFAFIHIRHTMLYYRADISLTWIAHNIYSKPTVKPKQLKERTNKRNSNKNSPIEFKFHGNFCEDLSVILQSAYHAMNCNSNTFN